MAFIDTFGNSIVQTGESTYSKFTLSTAVTSLFWPSSGQNGEFVASRQIDITSEDSSYILKLPDASIAPPGESFYFSNVSAEDFVVQDYDGNEIIAAVAPGEVYYIYLTDNTTTAGIWRFSLNGAGTSSADAYTLSGLGLTPLLGKLNTDYPPEELLTSYDVLVSDRAKYFVFTGGTSTLTLPVASIPDGFYVSVNNQSTVGGQLNVIADGGGTIDNNAVFALSPQESSTFIKKDNDYTTLGYGKETVFTATVNNKDISPGGTFFLLDVEAERLIQKFSGALTSDATIIMPENTNTWQILNETTGAYTLRIKTLTSTGILVEQNTWTLVTFDGTDTVEVPTAADSTFVSLADGSAAAPSLNYVNEPDFGWYRSGVSTQALVKASTPYLEVGVDGIGLTDGTAVSPAITFLSHAFKGGIYTSGDGILSFSGSGQEAGQVDFNGIGFIDGSISAPSASFITQPSTGLSLSGSSDISFSVLGVETAVLAEESLIVKGAIEINEGATQPPIVYVDGIPLMSVLKLFNTAQ